MKYLRIESTKFTPGIVLDPVNKVFEFYGFSLPENATEFYEPVLFWLNQYRSEVISGGISNDSEINVFFKMIYYNSSSLRLLVDIFHVFSDINQKGHKVNLNWYFDGEDPQMAEAGKELGEISKIPVKVLEIE